ncbi:hypothetical protein [Streptomyces sp. PT12]|uniref:hypothetical protein n=1 Tax=Streptomyces sp. PT12 TaxID=1510197 RepID=UPI000DE1DF31|nr:hypothetical protein [Streptomyces sp. PT12]RBM16114.1 hypothetical protein DEH69_17070 [Streptomyces sp. PT12]
MSDQDPSQAEGERENGDQTEPRHRGQPHPRRPPSQAEGERNKDNGFPRDARPRRDGGRTRR